MTSELEKELAGVEDASIEGKLPFARQGIYRVKVDAATIFKSFEKGMIFIVEVSVLESRALQAGDDPIAAGKKCKYMRMKGTSDFSKEKYYSSIKQYVAACSGLELDDMADFEITAAETAALLDDDEAPTVGSTLCMTCSDVTTKAGKPFTVYTFEAETAY